MYAYERAPLSRDLADLTARAINTSLDHAETYQTEDANYRPAGAFQQDLNAISMMPAHVKEVRSRLQATGVDTAGMALAHAIDHVRSLEGDLLRDPVPIWSPLTLSRAVLESTALICHLLDPSISAEGRLCRIAAQWLADSQPARTAAATFGAEHADDVRDNHRFKLDELAAGGFIVDSNDQQRLLRVRLGHASAPLKLNITEEAARIMPGGAPSSYRLASGAAHSRPWLLERSATRSPDGRLVGEGSTALTGAFTVMYCMKAWVTTWGGYFGIDVTGQQATMRATMETFARQATSIGRESETPTTPKP